MKFIDAQKPFKKINKILITSDFVRCLNKNHILFKQTMDEQLNNLKILKPQRKHLRNNSTSSEATLWKHLKGSQFEGRKFRRQHSILYYILDFYCPYEKINIELDG